MLKLRKKAFMILLSITVVIAMTPMMAFASEGTSATTVTTAEELTAAIEKGGAVVLGADVETTTTAQVTKNIVFDMNGHNLTVNKGTDKTNNGDAFYVVGGTLTIKDSASNGSIKAAHQGITVIADETPDHSKAVNSSVIVESGSITSQEMGIAVFGKGGNLTVNGGTIKSLDNAAVGGNGSNNNTVNDGGYTITVNDGALIGQTQSAGWKNCGLYHPNAGDVVINGGMIKGTTGAGIVVRGGNLTVNGGTISGNGTAAAGDKMGDATQTACGGIEVGYATGANLDGEYPGGIGKIEINGGTVTSGNDNAIHVYGTAAGSTKSKNSTIEVNTGTFSSDPSAVSGVTISPKSYVSNSNGTYTVALKAAKIGDTYYNTVKDAIAAAEASETSQTVTLAACVSEDISIAAGKTVTLDLNGYNLTGVTKAASKCSTGAYGKVQAAITNKGTLTVKGNGIVKAAGQYDAALFNDEGATAVLNGGTYNDSPVNENSGGWYIVQNHGDMTVNDGVTIANVHPENSSDTAFINGYDQQLYYGMNSVDQAKGAIDNFKANLPEKDATLTINGGTFTGGLFTVKNGDWYAEMTIKGGNFEALNSSVNGVVLSEANNNPLTVEGGTFTAGKDANNVTPVVKCKNKSEYLGKAEGSGMMIKGGTFVQKGTDGDVIQTLSQWKTNTTPAPILKINGGTFNGKINSNTQGKSYEAANAGDIVVDKTALTVNTGSFTVDPAEYVPTTSWTTEDNGKYSVRVLDAAKDNQLSLSTANLSLYIGADSTLTAKASDPNAKFTWSSSDESVAKVENGKVVAVAPGTATITVKAANYNYEETAATCTVKVSHDPKDNALTLSQSTLGLVAGESSALTATAKDPAAKVTWSSSDTAVATVDAAGKVTAVAAGTATIIAKTNNYAMGEVSATCAVTVQPKAGTTVTTGTSKNNSVYKVTTSTDAAASVTVTKPVSKAITAVTIPTTVEVNGVAVKVTAIAAGAYANCTKLTTVKVGSNVETVGSGVFSKCTRLTKVALGSNVKTVGNNVFYKCTSLKTVALGSKVKTIGSKTFYGTKKLQKITITSKSITKVGASAFKGINKKAKINVPNSKIKAYKKIFKKAGLPKTVKVY